MTWLEYQVMASLKSLKWEPFLFCIFVFKLDVFDTAWKHHMGYYGPCQYWGTGICFFESLITLHRRGRFEQWGVPSLFFHITPSNQQCVKWLSSGRSTTSEDASQFPACLANSQLFERTGEGYIWDVGWGSGNARYYNALFVHKNTKGLGNSQLLTLTDLQRGLQLHHTFLQKGLIQVLQCPAVAKSPLDRLMVPLDHRQALFTVLLQGQQLLERRNNSISK